MTMMIVITIMNNSTTLWHVWKNLGQKRHLKGGFFKINTFLIFKGLFQRQLKGSCLRVPARPVLISPQMQTSRVLSRLFPSKLSYFWLAKINMQISANPIGFTKLRLDFSYFRRWIPNYIGKGSSFPKPRMKGKRFIWKCQNCCPEKLCHKNLGHSSCGQGKCRSNGHCVC